MKYLQRLVRNLKTSWGLYSQSEAPATTLSSALTLGSAKRQKVVQLLPTKLFLDVVVLPIKDDRDVRIRTTIESSGAASEISLYDERLLDRKMQEISEQLGYSAVQLVSAGREVYEGGVPESHKYYRKDALIYEKRFPILETGLHQRRIHRVMGVSGVLPVDSSEVGWVPDYDFLPFGGRFIDGGSLEMVQPYFAQVRSAADGPQLMLSHSQFWYERGIDPKRGGVYRGKHMHFAEASSALSLFSLAEDIRQGRVRIPQSYKETVVGEWRSCGFQYREQSTNTIIIEFRR